MRKTTGIFVLLLGLCTLIPLGMAYEETEVKSLSIPYETGAVQEWSLKPDYTFTFTVVDTSQPLDLMVFDSKSELDNWRDGEMATYYERWENVASGTFDFTADEERIYYLLIEVSIDGDDDAEVQYKYGIDIPEEEISDDSPFLPMIGIIIAIISVGIIYRTRRR